jgi:LysM repeat protein
VPAGSNYITVSKRKRQNSGNFLLRTISHVRHSHPTAGEPMPVLTTAIATAAGAPLLLGAASSGWAGYTVREGDTLYDIAATHRTDVTTLVRANHLSDGGHRIRAGVRILVPRTTAAPAARPAAVRTARYTVRSGDTVGGLALRFKVTEESIRRANHLNRYGHIYAGQFLTMPARGVAAPVKAQRSTAAGVRSVRYTVRSGDTVSAIAVRTGSSIAAILKANRLAMTSRIQPGQVLAVPTRTAVRTASPSNTFAGRTYPDRIVNAAAANRQRLAARAVPNREATRALIARTARQYGVDPALALAIGYQESGWNQRQVSVANAIGVMQVIPTSGEWASDLVGRRLDLLSTRDNVTAGVVILKALQRSARVPDHAIAGYYQGLGSVQSRGMYADTKRYVTSIKALRARFS